MTETVELIAQLNASWRVLRIADRPGWGPPAWLIENSDGGGAGAVFRVAATVREFVQYNCGPIDPEAAAILARLPARCDRDPQFPSPPRYQKKRPAVVPIVKATRTKRPAPPPREPKKRPSPLREPKRGRRPALNLTPDEALARRRAQAAESARRCRALKRAADTVVRPPVVATPTKRPTPPGKRAALAAKFLQWRNGKPAHVLAGSQAIPAPPGENNAQAPRAASVLQQAEATP